jgi:peptidoglycan/xylan/chitin deacetylase (PgdA/CDA1 family)
MVKLDPLSQRLFGQSPKRGIIALMYHGTPAAARRGMSPYALPAPRFAEHLDFLKATGWETARVRDLADTARLSERTVLITFDDGYLNNYEGAFIPLAERGMQATWYIVTGKLGGHAEWLGGRSGDNAFLSAGQVKEMAEAGMEIGSHTVNHVHLDRVDGTILHKELTESRRELEDLLGEPVRSFAYPYGALNETVVAAVREAGYKYACTTRPGWYNAGESPLLIRRVAIFSNDNLNVFARKLVFADNDVSWKTLAGYYAGRLAARFGKAAAKPE